MGNQIKRLMKKIRIPRTTVLIMVFGLMSFYLIRVLFDLQILQGEAYIDSFQTKTTKTRVLKSTRGNIYDRNGTLLASNVLSYSITLEDNGSYSSSREKNLTINGVAYRVLKILSSNGDSMSNNFHIIVDENGEYAFDIAEGFNLSRFKADVYGYPLINDMKEEEANATAEEMISYLTGSRGFSIILEGPNAYTEEELTSHGLPLTLTKQEALDIAIIRYLLNTNSFKKYMPVTIATNVSEISVAAIMENKDNLIGIDVVEDSVRKYIDDVSMGPILGYIGKASAEELASLRKKNPDYSNDAIVGKAGIEQYMELTLQGTDGKETVTVDNLGKVLKLDENSIIVPKAGNDVYLTIDSEWQKAIYQILKQRVAGILISKIDASETFDYESIRDASQITVPIYDVYNALVSNSVIDINDFDDVDASQVEKNLYSKFQKKQDQVFTLLTNRLTSLNAAPISAESEQMQEYCSYICDTLLRDTLGIISKDAVDTTDPMYVAYYTDKSISMKDYLSYATSQNWIDISRISPEGEYLDSKEVYDSLTAYITDYLKTDTGFSKLLYKYMLYEHTISGTELCLVLYEQGILSKEDSAYENLASGATGAYTFMLNKIWNLEIEPSQLALMPCSASCVITEPGTGKVLACVSYPGYDVNRLTNNIDTEYFSKLALDQSSPFFNKATQQRTAPGSTFKLLSTIAGMGDGVIDENTYFNCTGSFDYVQPPINCWNIYGHGSLEITEAIQESCNYFFNMIGFQLGKVTDNRFSEQQSLDRLHYYASMIGLDQKTGIEISEAAPQVSNSYAVPSYIGQGTHLYTTTELCRYAATLANRGTVYNLTLVDHVISPQGETLSSFSPTVLNEMDVETKTWDIIHEGMRRVVETHKQFDDLMIDVSGKTGTAETDLRHPNHGLFIGFAPSYEPQYAIAVRIANGYSSGNACLAADDVFKYLFQLVPEEMILTGYASDDTSETSND